MRVLLTAITLAISLAAAAQDKKQASKKQQDEDLVFTKIEIEAQTDMNQWRRYILKNFPLPDSSAPSDLANINVVVSFIIDQYGRMTDVKVEKDPGYGLKARIEKVVRDYPGTWKPSIQCGVAVKSYKKIPIMVCLARE
jgi:periplasmic protein TonB